MALRSLQGMRRKIEVPYWEYPRLRRLQILIELGPCCAFVSWLWVGLVARFCVFQDGACFSPYCRIKEAAFRGAFLELRDFSEDY